MGLPSSLSHSPPTEPKQFCPALYPGPGSLQSPSWSVRFLGNHVATSSCVPRPRPLSFYREEEPQPQAQALVDPTANLTFLCSPSIPAPHRPASATTGSFHHCAVAWTALSTLSTGSLSLLHISGALSQTGHSGPLYLTKSSYICRPALLLQDTPTFRPLY